LTDDSLQSADKDQQEMYAVADKPRDAAVNFDTYRNLKRHRAVLPAIARLSCLSSLSATVTALPKKPCSESDMFHLATYRPISNLMYQKF